MLHPSTQQLIRKLSELTETGVIAWKEGEGGRCLFETEGYQVEIAAEPPSVRLLQNDGRELEHADAADLAAPWPDGDGTYATRVTGMARNAGRIARGAETAIAKILSSLSAPPKKQPEPEPEPAALSFDAPSRESAIAAVTAGLESKARTDDPPMSHTLPEPAPVAVPVETETAIDRVLAVQPPAPQPEPPRPEPAPPPVVEAKPAPVVETKPAPRPAPHVMDLPPPFADVTMQPSTRPADIPPVATVPQKPEPVPPLRPQPAPFAAVAPPPVKAPEPPVAVTPAPVAGKAGFGSIDSFARATPEPKPQPKPEPPKPPAAPLLMTSISARSNQTVESATAKDYMRSTAPAPAPQPAPPPAPGKKLEPAAAKGPDIYKPWA